MRQPQPFVLSVFLALASVGVFLLAPTDSLAKTTVTLDGSVAKSVFEGNERGNLLIFQTGMAIFTGVF